MATPCGSLAQLGEHLPYKQRVTGSSPVTSTTDGPVVQLVRTPACHAGGRRFEPVPGRHLCFCSSVGRAEDRKSSCRWFDSVRKHHICGFSSSGRAPPCQGGGSEFEPRSPLQNVLMKDATQKTPHKSAAFSHIMRHF